MLTAHETLVTSTLLGYLHQELVDAGRTPTITLPASPEVVEILNRAEEWAVDVGEPKRHAYDASVEHITVPTEMLCGYLADLLDDDGAQRDAKAKLHSADELSLVFRAELAKLTKRWWSLGKDDKGKMNVIIAAFDALNVRARWVERLARPFFDRNAWRMVQKRLDDVIDEMFKRPADGEPGIRRVQ